MARLRLNMDEIPDFVAPDPGKHRAKLLEVNEDVSQAGNDMLVWKWQILGGDSDGRTINSYTSLLDDALGGLKVHLKAFGYEGSVDVDTAKLHGKTAQLIITQRKYRDRETGEEKTGTSVANVLPDGGASEKSSGKPRIVKSRSGGGDDIPF